MIPEKVESKLEIKLNFIFQPLNYGGVLWLHRKSIVQWVTCLTRDRSIAGLIIPVLRAFVASLWNLFMQTKILEAKSKERGSYCHKLVMHVAYLAIISHCFYVRLQPPMTFPSVKQEITEKQSTNPSLWVIKKTQNHINSLHFLSYI